MKPPFPSATPTWHNDTYQSILPSRPELSVAGKTVVIAGAVGLFLAARSASMIRTRALIQPKGQWHWPRNRIRLLQRRCKQDRPPWPQRSQSHRNERRPSVKHCELLHPCRQCHGRKGAQGCCCSSGDLGYPDSQCCVCVEPRLGRQVACGGLVAKL